MSALTFDDYDEGFSHVTLRRTITEYDASSFIRNNGFNTPMFMDLEYASDPSMHGGRVVPGMLTISLAEGLCVGSGLVGKYGLALLEYRLTIQAPTYVGDTIRVRVEFESKHLTSRPDRGVVTTRHIVENQHGETVATYWATRLLKTRAWDESSSIGRGDS